MLHRVRTALISAGACASAVALALSGATPAAAVPYPDQDLVNKSDGGRLALYGDSTAEGAHAVALRDPVYQHRTEAWHGEQTTVDGAVRFTLKNKAADKCLQPATDAAERKTRIVVKTCDGSRLQTWVLHPERVGTAQTGWWMWRPLVNTDVAMTLDRYSDGAWSSLHLDTAYPSSDRLWKLGPDNAPWQ
ncbi:RICIN domain-containing protein [Streptomyces albidoflavus]